MSENFKKVLQATIDDNFGSYVEALEYFENNEHFVYPLERGGLHRDEIMKQKMNVLYEAGLLEAEDVNGWVLTNGGKSIRVYELNENGKKIFNEIFQKEPKMCYGSHWATAG